MTLGVPIRKGGLNTKVVFTNNLKSQGQVFLVSTEEGNVLFQIPR